MCVNSKPSRGLRIWRSRTVADTRPAAINSIALVVLVYLNLPAVTAYATTVDYLSNPSFAQVVDNSNGIGQTFTANDRFLQNGTLAITDFPIPPQWTDAHLQVRRGLPGSFLGKNGNILFTSSKIDFSKLPKIGTFGAGTVFGINLTDWGYDAPLSLTPGDTYSLLLINNAPGTRDVHYYLEFVGHQPNPYPSGGHTGHNYSYADDFWPDYSNTTSMSFAVVMVPEPSSMGMVSLAVLFLVGRRSKHPQSNLNCLF